MEILVDNIQGLPAAAQQILNAGKGKRVFLFYAGMGAGKTTLIKVICEALGVSEGTSSPTFSIVNEYASSHGPVYHFDFYRLKSEQEAFDMGYEEYFYSGQYCFVEWPEKIAGLVPADAVRVHIALAEGGKRRIAVTI